MPPKRRAPADTAEPKARKSKLAKEHEITNAEENEIREAFAMFSQKRKGQKEGVIPIGDVRRAMIALGIGPTPEELETYTEILDPEEEGFAEYSSFVAICALKFQHRGKNSDARAAQVDEAFALFAKNGEEKITLQTLKEVARALGDDVDEDLLRDMILEANGGKDVGRGVEKRDFEDVLKRAGVW